MNAIEQPKIVEAERVDGAVAIAFDDGRVGLYSSELLYSVLPLAQDITNLKEDD
ncbi:MAG: hypothetical protein V4555_04425 [Acidobacteriota bacterium]